MTFKDFIPPILIRLVKRCIGLENTKEYQNYSQAMKFCYSYSYDDFEFCSMMSDKTIAYMKVVKEKPFCLNQTNSFLLAAINQYINLHSKKKITVLDFGGACGAHFLEIKRFFPNDFSLKWYVVETDQMVKSAVNKGLHNNELNFVNSIEDIKIKIDFIHSSGALQCVSNPYEFINKLININASWMLFNRMMFNESDRDILTILKSFLSTNGPGKLPKGYSDKIVSYPHTTMSFQKFNQKMINNGYELEWMFCDTSSGIQLKNEKIIGKGLLYLKK
ncbi:MAG TPA: methyltransferase, TIGR04325 family [Bacteroidales bacterium]|nr:methyltransferase, TIGR04325 family [Bacteroidales bacterium]